MKYFLDTKFIEDGKTIDLVSLALVAEDGRTLYHQNADAKFQCASDWVIRNVFIHLEHFNLGLGGPRSCRESNSISGDARCSLPGCPWQRHHSIRDRVLEFCDQEKFGKPEFWGYYADYDWVVFCQLFGPMIALPKGYPMFCRDLKQLCDAVGNPPLPKPEKEIHHALVDALWIKEMHSRLTTGALSGFPAAAP